MHFTCFTLEKIGQASTWRKFKLYIRVQLNEIYHVGCFLFSFENCVWPPFCFFSMRMSMCEQHRFTLDSWNIATREPKSIIKKLDPLELTSLEIMKCLFNLGNIWRHQHLAYDVYIHYTWSPLLFILKIWRHTSRIHFFTKIWQKKT